MDINKFMDLVELTRKTEGTDWIYNRRVLRLKLRYLIECEVKKLHKHIVSNNEVAVCLKPDHVICCLKQNGLCTEDVSDCEFRQTDC